MINLSSVQETKLSWIYLLISDENNLLSNNGLSVSMTYLEKLKIALEKDDNSFLKDTSTPLPFNVSDKMLDCFNNKFYLEIENDYSHLEGIDTIYFHLWEYSQYFKHLDIDDMEEKKYLYSLQRGKNNQIIELYKKVKKTAPSYFVEKINNLKEKVITENHSYDDDELNDCINEMLALFTNKQ